jgi:predicted dehydrogenase
VTVSIGVLSAAHVHSDDYAAQLAERTDVEFAGIVDEDPERGRETAERHGTEYVAVVDAFLERIDAGVVCSPNVDHREWIDRAAAAGVDVLCEKPLATTVENAKAVVGRWRSANIRIGVAMPLRFCEPARRAKATLEAGRIGSVRSISGTNRGKMPGGWFTDPDLSGGGAVVDHTAHIVDLVAYLTGETVTEVYAEVETRFHDIPVEDVNVLSMELSDGTPFLLDGSWSKPDSWHTWGDATIELTGSDGTIAVDYTDQSVVHTPASGSDAGVNRVFHGTDTTEALIGDFVGAVRNDREPMTTPDEGLEAVAVVEAAYESAETGEPVTVDYGT